MGEIKTLILILITMAIMSACVSNQKQQENTKNSKPLIPENAGSVLTFSESSQTEAEHKVRVIITQRFIRIDVGQGSQNFILFDRNNKQIVNVVADEKSSISSSKNNSDIQPGFPINWRTESQISHALMRSSLKEQTSAKHHKIFLNDQACYDVVTLESILKEESIALAEYYQALARELKNAYVAQEDGHCFDAINIFSPKKRFEYGLPYREWSVYGYQRFLVDYQQKILFPADLFEIPDSDEAF